MFKKLGSLKLHLTVIIFALGFFLGINVSGLASTENDTFKYLEQFHFVYNRITQDYVEKISPKQLLEGAISGILLSLNDPYSRFFTGEDYKQFKENITGEFVGIGIEITARDNNIVIISPIDDSPAKKAGIQSGDIIIQINDTPVRPDNYNEISKEMKGEKGTELTLLISRQGYPEPIEFKMKREAINIKSVKYGKINESKNTGYLKIRQFFESTPGEVKKALDFMEKNNLSNLIIDLRDNPGGELNSAIQVTDYFLEKNKIIVVTKGRNPRIKSITERSRSKQYYSGDVIILVNEGSASSSEIFSGALQDNERAKLLGIKTFGKALVQHVIDIEPGISCFKLTVSKYYTPSGKMIHKKGIEPDYKVDSEIIPNKDRKNLGRIYNDKILQEFVKKNNKYNDYNVKQLQQLLIEKKMPVSFEVLKYVYFMELNRAKPAKLYNLEFDKQLKEAIKKLNG